MPIKNRRKVSYRRWSGSCPVPGIFIEGRFLNQFGFQLGDIVNVQYQSGQILITKS
jgi:hypothetical protein